MIRQMAEAILDEKYKDIITQMKKYERREKFNSLGEYLTEQLKVHGFKK
jgi:uncharacterized protein YqgV (UPF0045/DUF77 family)